MSAVSVTPDPAYPAGHALIRVSGAGGALGAPGFRVQRDAGWGDDKLGPGGWQSSDVLLQPDWAERNGVDLLLHVGWGVCRHLEAGVYEVSLPAADLEPTGVFWPDIAPLHGGSAAMVPPPRDNAVVPEPRDAAPPAPVAAPPAPEAPPVLPVPPAERPARGRLPAVAGVVLLAALLTAGGIYYAATRPADETVPGLAGAPSLPRQPAPTQPTPDPRPPASPGPLSLGALSVIDVIARAPDPAAMRAEGERRLNSARKDDGLLLLEAAADRSDPAAASALARLYDPVVFQPGGPIPRPDARQAARYYRDAARGGADVAAARDALRQRLQAQAQNGDLGADLMLKDFWP